MTPPLQICHMKAPVRRHSCRPSKSWTPNRMPELCY
ncbi:unnamed protein product [Dibothriocephalus latus]|uniref:Uncharacterized protein n=1 Tax=Dibothriocephalus latus TaxID=60516 RepID=A0A3P7P7A5_DIBLA|nr:unnamed protein product [Dibothriocephalus latus]